jgi:hypothetical protein
MARNSATRAETPIAAAKRAATPVIIRNFYILNVVEILVLGSNLIGVAEQGAHKSVLERLQPDDVFAAGKDKPSDSDHVHTADGFTDDGESVVANLAIRYQVVRSDQIARINVGFGNKLVDPGALSVEPT